MNSVNEKEKKLISALSELKNLKLHNPEIKQHLEALSTQKNQLEIEKEDLEKKYKSLMDDYNNLSPGLEYLFLDLIHQFFQKILSVFFAQFFHDF
jgi:predicted nuclease with TOPRIM domain